MKMKHVDSCALLHLLLCVVLLACADSCANAQHIGTTKGGLVVAQGDLAGQKEDFFKQWRVAMARGDESTAKRLIGRDRMLAAAVANDVGNQGIALFKKGDNKIALALFQATLALYQQLKDEEGEAVTEQNIGSVYFASGDCEARCRLSVERQNFTSKLIGSLIGPKQLIL